MPQRAKQLCKIPGCGALTDRGYCDEHQRQAEIFYDAHRESAAKRGYGWGWRRLRQMFLNANPWCADPGCHEPAVDVHHKVALRDGGTNEWDNLQALCHSCHSRQQKGRGPATMAVRGP